MSIKKVLSAATLKLIALGKRIQSFRKKRGLTQGAFAVECDMEKSTMCKIEGGKVNVSYLTLDKLSDGLDIELKELVPEKDADQKKSD